MADERSRIEARELFLTEFEKFNKTLNAIVAPSVLKDEMLQQVKAYAAAISNWDESNERVRPLLAPSGVQSQMIDRGAGAEDAAKAAGAGVPRKSGG